MLNMPKIIQGGMGVAVSDWKLAKSVSMASQLGVVSGTGIDNVLIRRLQDGDIAGHVRRALKSFPDQESCNQIIAEYYIENGKSPNQPYKRLPLPTINLSIHQQQLFSIGAFVEVFLAKENHNGQIGINLLEKIQIPNLATIYGAMLADVDYLLMGAGIPSEIPGVLDNFSSNTSSSLKINVLKSKKEYRINFNPSEIFPNISTNTLKRPMFLAIISSHTLAQHLTKKANGEVNGFIIETPKAGGHNAPPRGALNLDERGNPIYGDKDFVDLNEIKKLNKPFWLAGAYGNPEKFKEALGLGAQGIQVGTLFAFCQESGMNNDLKSRIVENFTDKCSNKEISTDPFASPTGFPFKVANLSGTLSEDKVYNQRNRICDIGLLREAVENDDGKIVYRCPAEPIDNYLQKGGCVDKTVNCKCLCNSLMSAVGLQQIQKNNYIEPALVTAGDELLNLDKILFNKSSNTYSARDVINFINY